MQSAGSHGVPAGYTDIGESLYFHDQRHGPRIHRPGYERRQACVRKRTVLYSGAHRILYGAGTDLYSRFEERGQHVFVQSLVSDYGGYILAPTLIVYGVFLLLGSKFPFGKFGFRASESSKRLRGSFGAFVLGLLFALAFCPISGVFYFGMLLPMAALEPGGYLYPVVFAVASGILVVLIAWIVAFGMSSLGRFYNRVNQFQKWLNLIVAVAFILAGIYYFVIYYI